MKKGNLKTIRKAMKVIRISIEENLSEKLRESVIRLGYDPKKLKHEIAKATRQIAKRIVEKQITKDHILAIDLKATIENELPIVSDKNNMDPDYGPSSKTFKGGVRQTQTTRKRIVKANSKNIKTDPVALAEQVALEKAKLGEPDMDKQMGSL